MASTPRYDAAHKWTDEQLEQLERRMSREYEQAAREMRGKQAKALEKYAKEKSMRERAMDDTPEARRAHKEWLRGQAADQQRMQAMVDDLSRAANQANVKAADMLNDHLPVVFAENANRAAFAIDSKIGRDTAFSLVDESTVRNLMGMRTEGVQPRQLIRETVWFQTQEGQLQDVRKQLSKVRGRHIDYAKDIRWNRQKFTSAITQGILQGESIPHIVKRTEEIFGQNRSAAYRAARTATTAAENAGRVSSYTRAERLGIPIVQEWMATPDDRTRPSHRDADGQRRDVGEYFDVGNARMEYPGDPAGGDEAWNCRCTLFARVKGFDKDTMDRWTRLPEGTTYEEWKDGKPKTPSQLKDAGGRWVNRAVVQPWGPTDMAATVQAGSFAGISEGQDILGTWQRRPDKFAFEIEDVMDAQGFDGKPRIVGSDEFDKAVKAANGGDGLIMQRSYSAPDKATLDAYRDMLYDGKWYVDCSTGGAQYGQGMYAAADYTGRLSDGIRSEMEHYRGVGEDRLRDLKKESEALDKARKSITPGSLSKNMTASVAEEDRQFFIDMKVRNKTRFNMSEDELMTLWRLELEDGDKWSEMEKAWNKIIKSERDKVIPKSYTETMTLDPSAKIIEHSRIADKRWEAIQNGGPSSILEMDDGAFAAAMGYDAINAVGHGASGSYTVILNRTKLIIRRPE